jgi:hypothetical protein
MATEAVPAIVEEIRSTKATADGLARDGAAPDVDSTRVLAGLIAHLAEQMERLVGGDVNDDVAQEEDISPEDAPAQPPREP